MVQLNSFSLLSKWGFMDGSELNWLYDFDCNDIRGVLVEVVRRKLLPALEQEVEAREIVTSHNPIRVHAINGVDVEEYHYHSSECPIKLTPEYVIVPGAEVLAIAREIGAVPQ